MPAASLHPSRRRITLRVAACVLASAALAGCAGGPGVVTVESDQTVSTEPTATSATPPPTGSTVPQTAPDTVSSSTTVPEPASTLPAITEPELLTEIPIETVVDVGGNKPARDYDQFVAVAFADIERWWADVYPDVYGDEFTTLAGGIYAGYPERDSALPGCGEPSTRYADLQLYVAFYCELDDFMIYDDGEESLIGSLAAEFGPAVMGIVLAHEYGHAIQSRIGALDDLRATIYTEQQADCFAGAWTGQAYRGESPLLRLGDADIRAGLIAMLEVRDPVGTNQFAEGGHGSAFDRVGAFQEGFAGGPARCSELLDNPLTLMPNEFQVQSDFDRGGDASYDCSDDPDPNCSPARDFLGEDLNDFWRTAVGDEFPAMTTSPVADLAGFECTDAVSITSLVTLCPSQNLVAYDEAGILELYDIWGDFSLGYFLGVAWGERAQEVDSSPLSGEERALLNDCFVGAWVGNITPDADGLTPRAKDTDGDGVVDFGVTSSPGDLDEAIRMAIIVGDSGANENVAGSPFEKIESFRAGVLGGLPICRARL